MDIYDLLRRYTVISFLIDHYSTQITPNRFCKFQVLFKIAIKDLQTEICKKGTIVTDKKQIVDNLVIGEESQGAIEPLGMTSSLIMWFKI